MEISASGRFEDPTLFPDADDHPDKPCQLNDMGTSLLSRFRRLGNMNDLDQSILVGQRAVHLTPDDHQDKAAWLNNLGNSLESRFEHLGHLSDLDQAILFRQQAVQFIPDDHPDKAGAMNNLGNSLEARFDRLGELNDINQCILFKQKAVKLTSNDHPSRPSRLNNLSSSLMHRFNRLGDLDDINQGVLFSGQALQLTPDDHPDKPSRLDQLGNSLHSRFDGLGNLTDLDQSISFKQQAVHLTPDGHPAKATYLNNLGNSFQSRVDRLGDLNDLDCSISSKQQAVQLTSDDHPDKAARLNNLAISLESRFKHLDNLSDLNESILLTQQAVQLTPNDHSDKASWLNNLGNFHLSRFERLGDLNDIKQSIELIQQAVQSTSNDQPEKTIRLMNLGDGLRVRFERLHTTEDANGAVDCYMSAAQSISGHAADRFAASYLWAFLAQRIRHRSYVEAYPIALVLLPRLAWLGSSISDRHFQIRKAGTVAREAAAAAIDNDNFITAVEWLDQGRSVIWGQLFQLRSPLDELKLAHPKFAAELEQLSFQLEGAMTPSTSLERRFSTGSTFRRSHQSLDYNETAHKREKLIESIRQLPGFERFLLPKSFSQLTRAAELGPVIMVTAGKNHCDALIVSRLPDNVLNIPLAISQDRVTFLHDSLQSLLRGSIPTTDILDNAPRDADSERLGIILISQQNGRPNLEVLEEAFQNILYQLWRDVVKPIVEALSLKTDAPCRVWWCPTGPFSFLPLHAAGDYSQHAIFGSKLVDYAISSYIPSFTSLIHALESRPVCPEAVKMLVVAQSSSAGQAFLPGARKELELIKRQATNQVRVTDLIDSEATIERVKQEMKDSNWAHFACHGIQKADQPTESALLLAGSSRLTLSEILSMRLSSKALAFLSACQTATGDAGLSDEAVHLAAGMLTAGYRGVIATMWSISDVHAPQVANDVYKHLFQQSNPDATEAAVALHYAVKNLRKKNNVPIRDWVPIIHVGL